MGFINEKARALRKYNKALSLGYVDKPIIEMIDFINSQEDYYTTSSCAGRVIFLHEYGKRKVDNDFIVKEHEKVNLDDFLKADLSKLQGRVWLKQEPFIIHIAAKKLDEAVKVLDIALKSGLKHSGVFVFKDERYVFELNGTHSMAVPISEGGKLLFPEDYLLYLLKLADEKLQKNKEFRDRFEKALREEFK
jgi:tRNA wybutosine-synthesizing protein 3